MTSGFSIDQTTWILQRCLTNHLLESNLKTLSLEDCTHLRITPAGSYYYSKLARTFVYLDAVCLDTPICDKGAFDSLADVYLIHQRIGRTRKFVTYLGETFNQHPMLMALLDWGAFSRDIQDDIGKVETSLERAANRAGR